MAEEKSNQVSERNRAAESLVAGYKGGEEMPLGYKHDNQKREQL